MTYQGPTCTSCGGQGDYTVTFTMTLPTNSDETTQTRTPIDEV